MADWDTPAATGGGSATDWNAQPGKGATEWDAPATYGNSAADRGTRLQPTAPEWMGGGESTATALGNHDAQDAEASGGGFQGECYNCGQMG